MITLESPITGDAIAQALRTASVAEARKFLDVFLADLGTDHYVYAREWIAAHKISAMECPRCWRHTIVLRAGNTIDRCEYCRAKLGAE